MVYGRQSLKVAETMQNLATILDALGAAHTAEEYLTEALEIEKKELGEGHIESAITMNNLGVLLAHIHQYDRAIEMLENSIQLRENYYGSQHHLTVCAKQNLEYIRHQSAQAKEQHECLDSLTVTSNGLKDGESKSGSDPFQD